MAVKTYEKGVAVQLSKNFKSTEFDCHGKNCCTETLIDEQLVVYLQKIRDHFGKPLYISGPYRCPEHNASTPNASQTSRHVKGEAADIYMTDVAPADIAKYAESIGVLGIGLYDTSADGHFVHIDTRTTKSFWFGHAQEYRETFGGNVVSDIPVINSIEVPKDAKKGEIKYNDENKPLTCMMTQTTCYRGTTKMEIKGVLWHSTGANNPTLKRYVQPDDDAADKQAWLDLIGVNKYHNDWNHITRQAGLNAWIGKLADGSVQSIQVMPWDFKPWGCGSGKNGSCNNGWIQFEICEDDLTNKEYFDTVYAEACQLTAYLCNMFNIDPNGTVKYNGVEVPTILCHYDSYKLGLGSNHGDIDHWFPKFGKSMQTVREDVAKLLPKKVEEKPTQPVSLYYVRKDWDNKASQVGAYAVLENAKIACDKAGEDYEVYNSNGIAIYPTKIETEPTEVFNIGDAVSLIPEATYYNDMAIPNWVKGYKLYVREIYKNGNIAISIRKTGNITGVVKPDALVPYAAPVVETAPADPAFTPYLVRINTEVLNIRSGAGTKYSIVGQVKEKALYTIVAESSDGKWGKMKSGAGWICLAYTKKVQ